MTLDSTHNATRIPPQSGASFELKKGEVLRVTDPDGQQVSDLFAFKLGDLACSLFFGRSIDYASRLALTTGHHPSRFGSLCTAFEGHGVRLEQISTTFNIFMNAKVEPDGAVRALPPLSKAGDYIELQAQMDMVCALTACR